MEDKVCEHLIGVRPDRTTCSEKAEFEDEHGHSMCRKHWVAHREKHGEWSDYSGAGEYSSGEWSETEDDTFEEDDSNE
jgi:hypothetical protein